MIKKITLVAAIVLFAFGVNAQIKINAGAGLSLPMGTYGDFAKMGIGGSIGGKYMLGDNMSVGVGLSYYTGKDKITEKVTLSMMPIVGNFTYYFTTEGFKPYGGVDLGVYMFKAKATGYSASETYKGFAPVLGFEYGLSDKLSLDVNAKYNYVLQPDGADAITFIGINFGIVYSL